MEPEPPPAGGFPDGPAGNSPDRPASGQHPPPRRVGSNRMLRPPHPGQVRNPVWYALVTRAERAEHEAVDDVQKAAPAWRRRTRGEPRWPVTISVIIAIVLQLRLPDQLTM